MKINLAQLLPPGVDPSTFQLDPNNPSNDPIYQLIWRAIDFAAYLGGGIAVILIIVGSFQYFTAYGNEEQAKKAKATITWAIVGLVVIILSRWVVGQIWDFASPTPLIGP